MTITIQGTPYTISVGGRLRSFEVDGKLVVAGFVTEYGPSNGFASPQGERMVVAVLGTDGAILAAPTVVDTGVDFDAAINGWTDNIFHVAANGSGGYRLFLTEEIYGFNDDAGFHAGTRKVLAIDMDAGGGIGAPQETTATPVIWEETDSLTLSTGNIAILQRDRGAQTVTVEILDPSGDRLVRTELDGTFGTSEVESFFYQLTRGLDLVETGGKLMALHIDSFTDEVYGQLLNLDGTPFAAEFQISDGTHGDGSNAAVWQDGGLEAAVLANGNVVATWASTSSNSVDGIDVWMTIIAPDGSIVLADTLVNVGHEAGEQFHPNVHPLADGGFAITWNNNWVFSATAGGLVQQFDANGARVGTTTEVDIGTAAGVGYGLLTSATEGIFVDWYGEVRSIGETPAPPVPGIAVTGNATPEAIDGTAGDDTLDGAGGNDTIDGMDGADSLFGGVGADEIMGGAGNDKITAAGGADSVYGGSGDDVITGGGSNDSLFGGDGDDTMNGGIGFDTMMGGAGNDDMTGLGGFDLMLGGSGDDTLAGNFGNDELYGGDGRDVLSGGLGGDTLWGDAGNDQLSGADGADSMLGGAGMDTLFGGSGSDSLYGGSGDDIVYGGAGTDTIYGGDGSDRLLGGDGGDFIVSGQGMDSAPGSDTLDGGAGNDTLAALGGEVTMIGGTGADSFIFAGGMATIADYSALADQLLFEADLFAGTPPTEQEIIDAAVVLDGNLVITVDATTTLTIEGLTNANLLAGHIDFV